MYFVTVSAQRYGSQTAEYRRGAQDEIVMRFEEPGIVEARLTGYRGSAYEGRLRFALAAGGDNPMVSASISGDRQAMSPEGVQTFTGMQPGEYQLHLLLEGDRMGGSLARQPVTVKGGRNEFSMAMPVLHTVTVTGAEGQVLLRRAGEDRRVHKFQQAGADGRTVFDGIPDGDYTVQSGSKNQSFHLPGTTEVKL